MGAIKRLAKSIVVNFYDQLNLDFENNKLVVESVTSVSSKSFRNRVAGYATTIMRQISENEIQTLEEIEYHILITDDYDLLYV